MSGCRRYARTNVEKLHRLNAHTLRGGLFTADQQDVRVGQDVPQIMLLNSLEIHLVRLANPGVHVAVVKGVFRVHQQIEQKGKVQHSSWPGRDILQKKGAIRREPLRDLPEQKIAIGIGDVVQQIQSDNQIIFRGDIKSSDVLGMELHIFHSQLLCTAPCHVDPILRDIHARNLDARMRDCKIQGK